MISDLSVGINFPYHPIYFTGNLSRDFIGEISWDKTVKDAEFNFIDLGEMIMGAGGEAPIEVKIFGKDLSILKDIGTSIAEDCRNIAGFRDVELSPKAVKPEIQIKVDREKTARFGLTVGEIGRTVKEAFRGIVAGKHRIGGDEYDLRVRF